MPALSAVEVGKEKFNHMNRKITFTISAVVVIVVFAGAVGYLILVRKLTLSIPPPTPIPTTTQVPETQQSMSTTPTPSSETANWKTYRNTKYGYELKYPAQDWYPDNLRGLPISETDDAFMIAKVFEDNSYVIPQSRLYMRFSINATPNPNNLTAKEWIFFGAGLNFLEGPDPSIPMKGPSLQDYKQRANDIQLPYRNDLVKSIASATTFLGIPAIETTAEQWGSLQFPKDEQMFEAIWSITDGKEKPTVAIETFNQILSTFKFIR